MDSLHHEYFVRSLAREEYLVTHSWQYCFDVNIIRIEAVQDKYVGVYCGGSVWESTSLICKDLDG